jgi:hypothetical protein
MIIPGWCAHFFHASILQEQVFHCHWRLLGEGIYIELRAEHITLERDPLR